MHDAEYADLCREVRAEVHALVKDGLAEIERRQDAMHERLRGTNTRGMSFPVQGFSVSGLRDRFHLNIPSSMADAAMVETVKGIVQAACERHGVELAVSKDVRGGSNYVLEGGFREAPRPAPGM